MSSEAHDLLPRFRQILDEYNMVDADDKIVIAVSGGPDSMALFHLFWRLKRFPIAAFHLNHCLRVEAQKEADFVERTACEWGVPHHVTRFDVSAYLQRTGESKQEGARRVRYGLLEEYLAKIGYTKIATGHHRDDQAETVLMRILRGSGLQGLGGIRPCRGAYIRPLLPISRQEIMAYLTDFGVSYCWDRSNDELDYLRNQLRLELLPHLEDRYNPNMRSLLYQLGEIARADEDELQDQVVALGTQLLRQKKTHIELDRQAFCTLSLSMQRRVLRYAIALYCGHSRGIGFDHVESVRRLASGAERFRHELPAVFIEGTTNSILFGAPSTPRLGVVKLPVPGEVIVGDYQIRSQVFTAAQLPPPSPCSEDFALDDLAFPLTVRGRLPGDRMHVFGLEGTKKIKSLLVDAKIPRMQKERIPLICDRDDIIMLVGVRRSEKGRILPGTKRILRIAAEVLQDCQTKPPVL